MTEYLVDTSAWTRFGEPKIGTSRIEELGEAVEQGRVWASTILLLEQGFSARNTAAYAREASILRAMPFADLDGACSARACVSLCCCQRFASKSPGWPSRARQEKLSGCMKTGFA